MNLVYASDMWRSGVSWWKTCRIWHKGQNLRLPEMQYIQLLVLLQWTTKQSFCCVIFSYLGLYRWWSLIRCSTQDLLHCRHPIQIHRPYSIIKVANTWHTFASSAGRLHVQHAWSDNFDDWTLCELDALPSLPNWVESRSDIWDPDVIQG